ncbi:OsmC family protein [Alicyclobacillus mali (ex Roth et al. 2021)]|uniref:OsmC family protein n=1 Tax=Alicyclobacillus mali (ex Roth et al. 2021) TaxID=1123961 RepID=UPI001A8CEFDD|nr:OsmC family protein [Alicyclobacillus mali (ex Roth et al. 2021)]
MKHMFHYEGRWTGGRAGSGEIRAGGLQATVTRPAQMGGPGIGTNPDEMLLSAAATCYMMTLAFLLEARKIPVMDLTVFSTGVFSEEGGLHCESIAHRPKILLDGEGNGVVDLAMQLAREAESRCMVSRALAGNVSISVEPEVFVNDGR